MAKYVSMAEINALVAEAKKLGAKLSIPYPKDRPLVIIEYIGELPETHRFKSTKQAKKWLVEFISQYSKKQSKIKD